MKTYFSWKKILIGLSVLLIGFIVTTCSITKKNIKSQYQKVLNGDPLDVIIVPGIPFEGKTWHQVMKMRVYWSVHLFELGLTKNIIYSGSSVYSPYVEAEVMKRYAVELGIPEEKIILEPNAEHSTENVFYSYHLAKKLGFENIALATDPFQSKLMKKFIRKKLKKKVKLIPIDFDLIHEQMTLPDPQIDTADLHVQNFVSITDRESWWKRFMGTLGNNIDYDSFEKVNK
ncbi:YdcF family protein [Reichenbachiella sp.]|uniref:YdcF family protein n=1 Tax=Reichenbachiella sp. TaxID=2184521 RepID=UPI00329A4287